ncbi:MAG: hypothetical protein ABIJ00_01140, partial [Candidatus Eisenbacteria bacterium]
ASQYVYLLLRSAQAPAYLHPQAHFFEMMPLTGTDNPVYNWVRFVTGATWRAKAGLSVDRMLVKSGQLMRVITTDLSLLVLILAGVGIGVHLLWHRHRRMGLFLSGILVLQILYFLTYWPSFAAMVIPLWTCIFIFAGVGAGLGVHLGFAHLPPRPALRWGSYLVALVLTGVVLFPSLAAYRAPDQDRDGPAVLISEMIKTLPEGTMVDGITWKYWTMLEYVRIVEGRDLPFETGICDSVTINQGNGYVLGTLKAKTHYLRGGFKLEPVLSVAGAHVLYHLRRGPRLHDSSRPR